MCGLGKFKHFLGTVSCSNQVLVILQPFQKVQSILKQMLYIPDIVAVQQTIFPQSLINLHDQDVL